MEFLDAFNDEQEQANFNSNDIQNNNIICTVVYILPILFFLPYIVEKNSSYCKFHANQSFVFLVACLGLGLVSAILSVIPILGTIISSIIGLVILIVAILLAMSAYQGKAIRIPFIGSMFDIFK